MKRDRLGRIGIRVGIAFTWSLFAAFIVYGLMSAGSRDRSFGENLLDAIAATERMQLKMATDAIEKDLRQEAAYLNAHDSLAPDELTERWRPLLAGQSLITSVSVAYESGRSFELRRDSASWIRTNVPDPTMNDTAEIATWPLTQQRTSATLHHAQGLPDPRAAAWFGQALEDASTEPTWSVANKGARTELHLSILVRARTERLPYRVLHFTVQSTDLLRTLVHDRSSHHIIYLGSDGRPWLTVGRTDTGVIDTLLSTWSRDKRRTPFTFPAGQEDHIARITPHSLNGSQFFIAVIVPMSEVREAKRSERIALWSGAFLLAVLGVLLLLDWSGRRRTDKIAERQERKRRTQEQRLGKALGEREILEREVHHRVKNNMQVVSSLLSLQADRVTEPGAQREFARGKRRIDSMALVHHKLYAQPDLRAIDLQVFLSQVASSMKAMHEPASRAVSHSVDTAGIKADADTSIQVGLILCELLTNCYQYAFPYVTGGHVDITVNKADGDLFLLTVKDNGKGIERDPMKREQELGLELVEALAEQIDGGLRITRKDGTLAEVTFRMQGPARVLNI